MNWFKKNWHLIIAPLLVLGAVAGAFFLGRQTAPKPDPDAALDGRINWVEGDRIGYASNVITSDPETLQDAVDRMIEKSKEKGITVEYKNLMVSDDGVNFACFFANSTDNDYDMFFTIYSDINMTEESELFRSQLLRPGERFEKIAFMKQMPPGQYKVYLVQSQVYDQEMPDGQYLQTIRGQVAVTIDMVVNPY